MNNEVEDEDETNDQLEGDNRGSSSSSSSSSRIILIITFLSTIITVSSIHLILGHSFSEIINSIAKSSTSSLSHQLIISKSLSVNEIRDFRLIELGQESLSFSVVTDLSLDVERLLKGLEKVEQFGHNRKQSDDQNHRTISVSLNQPSISLPLRFGDEQRRDKNLRVTHQTICLTVTIIDHVRLSNFLKDSYLNLRTFSFELQTRGTIISVNPDRFPILKFFNFNPNILSIQHLRSGLDFKLPQLPPNLLDPTRSIKITEYSFYSSTDQGGGGGGLCLRSIGSIANPLKDILDQSSILRELSLSFRVPWKIPLRIDIKVPPDDEQAEGTVVELAKVWSKPFRIEQSPKSLNLSIEGRVLRSENFSRGLSYLLKRFLNRTFTPVNVLYDPDIHLKKHYKDQQSLGGGSSSDQIVLLPNNRNSVGSTDEVPRFLDSLLRDLNLTIDFPGSKLEKQLIENLEIEDMKISLNGTTNLICSGNLTADINLPDEMEGLVGSLRIESIKPDVIVFDGNLTETLSGLNFKDQLKNNADEEGDDGDYPENAFGRLNSKNWIPSELIVSEDEDQPGSENRKRRVTIRAEFNELGIEILEGRSKGFRRYALKYLFNRSPEGVLTSVSGNCKIRIRIDGFNSFDSLDGTGSTDSLEEVDVGGNESIEIDKIKVRGTFFVGAKK
ncbi:hypothetical protein BY996DRAFT_7125800 [Phakopsora pachyrhizi]|uniref:Uncharacterized protein n=1 Tax=Phakopsora pachyrhizi TaxID=170000 RepID=A0AAV0BQU6_PHAPC|nr:hypothetical protein BY996DRAFT_7125800 [Phakopsora pachyrhizi]CAH7689745.1 hypothetical protein PPACK8108_LOCUS24874 [Phakopsora pachyrhizi]